MPPPLISFPPLTEPSNHSTNFIPIKPKQRSFLIKAFYSLPLFFIFLILSFTFYTFIISLAINYLLLEKGEWIRSLIYSIVFLFLFFGSVGGVAQAVIRGPGSPSDILKGGRDEEEGLIGRNEVEGLIGRNEEESGLLFSNEDQDNFESSLNTTEDQSSSTGSGLLHNSKNKSSSKFHEHNTLQRKSDGSLRYCKTCRISKPDRTHHCSICERCVLKMDHHCPWLVCYFFEKSGCVGFGNYKFFLLFLLYSGVLGIYCAAVMFYELSRFVQAGPDNFELAPLAFAMVALLGMVFGLSLTLFGAYHFYLACINRSTIEAMERSPTYSINPKQQQLNRQGGTAINHYKQDQDLTRAERKRLSKAYSNLHIFDSGILSNLSQVFGGWDDRWIWILPLGRSPGNGTNFPINHSNLNKLNQITAEIRLGTTSSSNNDSSTEFEAEEEGSNGYLSSDLERSEDGDDWGMKTSRGRRGS